MNKRKRIEIGLIPEKGREKEILQEIEVRGEIGRDLETGTEETDQILEIGTPETEIDLLQEIEIKRKSINVLDLGIIDDTGIFSKVIKNYV